MRFTVSRRKLRNHLQNVLNRLHLSKPNSSLSTIVKAHEQIPGLRISRPMPLPVLNLPTNLSRRMVESSIFEGLIRYSMITSQSLEEHRITVVEDVNQDTVGPDDGLMVKNRSGNEEEGGGGLGSPISLKMASWTQTLTSETLSSQIRLSADQRISHLPHLMIEKPSDPIRHSQQITPEAGSSSSRMTSSHSEAYFGQTSSSVSEPTQGSDRDSSADTLTSVYKDRNTLDPSSASTKPPSHLFLTPTHHQSLPINLNLTPARRFLKRPGPIPHSQPLSSKLLQSILSAPELRTQSSFSVRQELGCHPSDDPHLQFLERVCPGRCPIEIYSLSDHEPLPILSSHITLHPPILSLSDSVSCPSINSSLSSFMTDS